MRHTAEEKAQAVEQLRELLHPGDTVYTILRHVSRSGMSRVIQPVIIRDNETSDLTWLVCKLDMWPRHKRYDGLTVGGCGMDMGFHLVYELSRILFPAGFAVEGIGRNGDTSGWDKDGGYALKQRWL